MAAFSFSLERVLEWRRTRRDLEELKVREIYAAIERSNASIAKLRAQRASADLQALSAPFLTGLDLRGLADHRQQLQAAERTLQTTVQEQQRRLIEQRQRWMEAERQCQLIEKLRQRKLSEFEAQQNREMETFATDMFLARWR